MKRNLKRSRKRIENRERQNLFVREAGSSILFTNEKLQKLRSRIGELDKEYKSERKNYDILKQYLKNKAQSEKSRRRRSLTGHAL